MGSVYHRIGQLATEKADSHYKAAIAIPFAKAPVLTATYGGQVMPGHNILTGIGNSKVAAAHVMPLLVAGAKSHLKEEISRLEDTVLEAEEKLDLLKQNAPRLNVAGHTLTARAKPFADYAAKNGSSLYSVGSKISSEQDLTKANVNDIISAVYEILRKKGATSRVKEGIRDYIRTGDADEQLLKFLANVMPELARPAEYDALTMRIAGLNAELQQTTNALKKLESGRVNVDEAALAALTQTLAAIKQGQPVPVEVVVDGIRIKVDQEIQKIIGTRYGTHFLSRVDDTASGGSSKRALVPYELSDAVNGPDGLQVPYLKPQQLANIVSLLVRTLDTIVVAYFVSDEQQRYKDVDVPSGLLVSSLLPKNPAFQQLYPLEAVAIQGQPRLTEQISELTADAFKTGLMAELAAKKLGMGSVLNRQSLDGLVLLLDNVMPVSPMPIYELDGIGRTLPGLSAKIERGNSELNQMKEQIQKLQAVIHGLAGAERKQQITQFQTLFNGYNSFAKKWREEAHRYNGMVRRAEAIPKEMMANFCIDVEAAVAFDDKSVEETMADLESLCGNEFSFVKQVLEKREGLREFPKETTKAEIEQANDKQAVTL